VRTAHGAVEIAAEDFRWAMNAPRDRATTLKSGDIEVKVSKSAGTAEISGRGFGHGVGLCQHGAQAMAKSGASAKKILDRYYPGASIVRGWN
jgi:stage II sporulation protein D